MNAKGMRLRPGDYRARLVYAEAMLNDCPGHMPDALRPRSAKEILALRAEAGKLSPLEVMLASMDRFVEEANALSIELEQTTSARQQHKLKEMLKASVIAAISAAKDASPYTHPKLASIAHSAENEATQAKIELFSAHELRAKVRGVEFVQSASGTEFMQSQGDL